MDLRCKLKSLKILTFTKSRNTLVLLHFSQLFIRERGRKGGKERGRERKGRTGIL